MEEKNTTRNIKLKMKFGVWESVKLGFGFGLGFLIWVTVIVIIVLILLGNI